MIGKLTQLTNLTLNNNQITEIPETIGKLTQLTNLILNNNEIVEIPETIGKLTQLTNLTLNNNQITEIPETIGKLTQLTNLLFNNNIIAKIPSSIGKLNTLTWVRLNNNRIEEIPEVIGKLTKLTSLNLSNNRISKIPVSIGKLVNLTSIDFDNNQIEEIPEAIGKLTKLTSLSLNNNQIVKIPVSIGKLVNLTSIDFDNNQIKEIPEAIGKLTKLTSLSLNNNQIVKIPVSIGELVNLTSIDFDDNQIEEIPEAIGELVKLTNLSLNNNLITEVPLVIGKLKNLSVIELKSNRINDFPIILTTLANLKIIIIGKNKISEIPQNIGRLIQLNNLDISGNKIRDIPKEIGDLAELVTLDVSGNDIKSIPVEISNLANLTRFVANANKISEIPLEISKLNNLESFYLWRNEIENIPSEICSLKNLSQLDLGKNKIREIPESFSELTNLAVLYLDDNQIEKIPLWLQYFKNLEQLNLCGNPIFIPREILVSNKDEDDPGDLQAILSFYFQTQDSKEREPLYEAKFIIVGEGESGKTTFAKKIQNSDYKLDLKEETTHGINIIRWDFIQPNGKLFRVNIWDFGGQDIYHATHQFFLTERSLYTLVVDGRRENPNLYYWLNIVRLLSDNSPVFIIKNEKQGRQCEFNEGQLRGEFDNLQNSVSTDLATNRGLEDIKKAIESHITALPHIRIPIPKTWVRIRNVLENYSQSQNYISVEEYYTLCQTNGLKDRQEMLIISKYLHDLGICLHFQKDPVLKHRVILNPTWATNAVYRVTDTQSVKDNNGCFTTIDLATIWRDSQYAEMHDELLQLMQNFGICYPIRNIAQTYIAPSLLSKDQPTYDWNETDNLILRYEYEFMPRGILPRFIVEMHNLIESQPEPPATSQLVWKEGVILTDSRARAEIIELYDKREIRIRVVGFQKKTLLDCIRHEFQKIHVSYERLQYQELIPCNCPKCDSSQTPYTYSLEILREFLKNGDFEIQCQKGRKMVNVRRLIDELIEPMRDDNGLTPSQKKRLEKERDSLQSTLELRADKLDVLRKNLAIATDPSTKFKLEKEIDDEEDNIQKLTDRLEEIEQQLNNKFSFGKTRSIRAKPRTPADSPSASIVNHNYINKIENNMTGNTNTFGGDYVRGNKIEGDYVAGDKIGTQINNVKNLAQAVIEIQSLLDNLAETYNPNTETGQAKIGKDAIESIEQNPTLKGRIINAIKESSYTAVEEAVDRPAVKILMAAFKGFTEGK
jgi:Leucine-rich repeat (LRR) protein/signal recognition particle receptor subunit beta